jgi:hypothetical protein
VDLSIKFDGFVAELLLVGDKLRQFQNLIVLVVQFDLIGGEVLGNPRFDFKHFSFE